MGRNYGTGRRAQQRRNDLSATSKGARGVDEKPNNKETGKIKRDYSLANSCLPVRPCSSRGKAAAVDSTRDPCPSAALHLARLRGVVVVVLRG